MSAGNSCGTAESAPTINDHLDSSSTRTIGAFHAETSIGNGASPAATYLRPHQIFRPEEGKVTLTLKLTKLFPTRWNSRARSSAARLPVRNLVTLLRNTLVLRRQKKQRQTRRTLEYGKRSYSSYSLAFFFCISLFCSYYCATPLLPFLSIQRKKKTSRPVFYVHETSAVVQMQETVYSPKLTN